MRIAGGYSEAADISNVIYTAATDGTDRLRYMAGKNAEAMIIVGVASHRRIEIGCLMRSMHGGRLVFLISEGIVLVRDDLLASAQHPNLLGLIKITTLFECHSIKQQRQPNLHQGHLDSAVRTLRERFL
jgi:hypothetical protein